jgi:hypothetical protein
MEILDDPKYNSKSIFEIVTIFDNKVNFVIADHNTMKTDMFIIVKSYNGSVRYFQINAKNLWMPVCNIFAGTVPFDECLYQNV